MDRIVYFSSTDMSIGLNLQKAEILLEKIDINGNFDLNSLIEIYHIKQFFDNEIFLKSWDEKTLKKYSEKVEKLFEKLKQQLLSANVNSLVAKTGLLEFDYRKSFWQLVNNLHVYKRISAEQLGSILSENPYHIFDILEFKNLVQNFGNIIREFLLDYPKSAELLLSHEMESIDVVKKPYFFPKALSIADKESIIEKYLANPKANLNYVRLIVASRDRNDFKLSPRTRLNAKKKAEELNNAILQSGNSLDVGVQVTFHKNQKEPTISALKNQILEVSHSETLLNSISDEVQLFQCFSKLFEFVNRQGIITLVSKDSELNILEKVSTKSKNEYSTGYTFHMKNNLSLLQLKLFEDYLNRRNCSLERVITTFIDKRLKQDLEINQLQFKFSRETASNLEKIRHTAPEIEFLLKQYQLFVDEGVIDFELLQFNSTPLTFSSVGSILQRKYIYISSSNINKIKFYFFSDQSPLYYIDEFGTKYHSFYELLKRESVKYSHFHTYQTDVITNLVEEGHLFIDEDNNVRIKNEIYIQIVGILHREEVVSYWHFPIEFRKVLDEMVEAELLRAEGMLFSEQEVDYFNFYLNKKEFTNGLDIRNKYLHGTNKNIEAIHETEYIYLLRILIVILLKIEDDLVLRKLMETAANSD